MSLASRVNDSPRAFVLAPHKDTDGTVIVDVTLAALRIDLVILACAISAGIHGALVREHFEEGTGAGLGFVAATVLLAVLAVALTRRPSQLAFVATAAVFAGLIASYALVITTGFPVLHPERGSGRRARALHQGGRSRRPRSRGEPAAATVARHRLHATERNTDMNRHGPPARSRSP